MSCTRRAEFESAPSRPVPADFSVFTTFSHSTTDRPKKFDHYFDFKHHHSTHPDGPAFCGCSGTSKIIGKHENPYENRRFPVSGGAGTRGLPRGLRPPGPLFYLGLVGLTQGLALCGCRVMHVLFVCLRGSCCAVRSFRLYPHRASWALI